MKKLFDSHFSGVGVDVEIGLPTRRNDVAGFSVAFQRISITSNDDPRHSTPLRRLAELTPETAPAQEGANSQDDELSLKLRHSLDGPLGVRKHKADVDVRVLDAAQANPNIVTRQRHGDFLLHLVVDRRRLDGSLVRHQEQVLVLANFARLEFADDDAAHVGVLFRDGDHQGRVRFAVEQRHLVEEGQERFAPVVERQKLRSAGYAFRENPGGEENCPGQGKTDHKKSGDTESMEGTKLTRPRERPCDRRRP